MVKRSFTLLIYSKKQWLNDTVPNTKSARKDVILYKRLCNNYPAGICLLKVNNRNTRTRFEICSKLTIKIPE